MTIAQLIAFAAAGALAAIALAWIAESIVQRRERVDAVVLAIVSARSPHDAEAVADASGGFIDEVQAEESLDRLMRTGRVRRVDEQWRSSW